MDAYNHDDDNNNNNIDYDAGEGFTSSSSSIRLQVRWHGQSFTLDVLATATVWELKLALQQLTGVAPHAQKLIGLLPRGRHPPDQGTLEELGVRSGQRCMLVGIEATRAAQLASQEEEHRARTEAEADRAKAQAEVEQALRAEEQRRLEEEETQRRQERILRQEQMAMVRREGQQQWVETAQRRQEERVGSLTVARLQCYSSIIASNPRLDRGDKIVLPAALLEAAVNQGVEFPYTFKLRKVGTETPAGTSSSVAHCGVLDFEAPAGLCYLPASIMTKLALQDGDHISLESVRLPKGEYVQMQPQSASWIDIPMAVREAILANQLRNYQTLTVDDTVNLSHASQDFKFLVTKVLPVPSPNSSDADTALPGISIIDADVAVDVIEPREAFSPITLITLDSLTTSELGLNESVTYQLRLDGLSDSDLLIELSAESVGDVDLYVSHSPDNRRPTPLAYTWKAQSHGSKLLQIEAADPQLVRAAQEGWLYITVHAYATPSDSAVRFSLSCKHGGEGRRLKLESLGQHQVDVKQCSHCRREIPTTSYSLHEMACARHNWRCEVCGAVVPLAEKDKHRAVAHVVAECVCGVALPPAELQVHKEFECTKRLVSCLYCELQVPLDQRGEHQGMCGNRTVTCAHCHARHKRNGIKKHLVEEHGIYPQHADDAQHFAE